MPEGFSLGPLFVRFYGIILMLGAVAGAWLATREAKRRGYEPEIVWDLLTYLLIGGIIGARSSGRCCRRQCAAGWLRTCQPGARGKLRRARAVNYDGSVIAGSTGSQSKAFRRTRETADPR